ncbi:MAG: ribonuclease H-like domain-containing protein, partial [bacterium]
PFVENYFGIKIDAAHIDLRYVLRSLGYAGGLKGCEKQLGIDRGDLDGVDGYFAVLLWNEFVDTGKERALDTLLAYNIEDAINLESLMVMAYNLKLRRTPFAESLRFALPESPRLPFEPDRAMIRKIRERYRLG